MYLKSRINEMLQCKCYTTVMIILGDATCLHLIDFKRIFVVLYLF